MVFTFLENHWIYVFLLMPQSPHLKLLVELFENLFPPGQKGWEETMISSTKIQSENMKMTWIISFFPLDTIVIFLNGMGLTTIL